MMVLEKISAVSELFKTGISYIYKKSAVYLT